MLSVTHYKSHFSLCLTAAVVPDCMICLGRSSSLKCLECKSDFVCSEASMYFCEICSKRVHRKLERREHKTERAVDISARELELLSVICIETSRYVCFTREVKTGKWIFFDSMADRVCKCDLLWLLLCVELHSIHTDDTYYIPKVTDCTRELNEWVYSGDRTRLMSTQPRQLPELVRRFTQNIYMCVYIQPEVARCGKEYKDDQDDYIVTETSKYSF